MSKLLRTKHAIVQIRCCDIMMNRCTVVNVKLHLNRNYIIARIVPVYGAIGPLPFNILPYSIELTFKT